MNIVTRMQNDQQTILDRTRKEVESHVAEGCMPSERVADAEQPVNEEQELLEQQRPVPHVKRKVVPRCETLQHRLSVDDSIVSIESYDWLVCI